jgi:hypothetical protein
MRTADAQNPAGSSFDGYEKKVGPRALHARLEENLTNRTSLSAIGAAEAAMAAGSPKKNLYASVPFSGNLRYLKQCV